MMAPTHVATGLAIAVPVATVAPEYAAAAVAGSTVGSLVPDLDLLVGEHRRTLHFPTLGWVVAVPVALAAVVTPSAVTVGVALCALSFAVHSAADVLGAGEEVRPWERTNPNAVYCHLRQRWLRARYRVRYDGAPEDLLLTVVLAAPTVVLLDGPVRWFGLLVVGIGAAYALVRKWLPPYVARLVG
ncbi:hypothetical protein [Halococcus saccharolyticus]|nr:hypothetical protein [Halococcus saccharolyticus]